MIHPGNEETISAKPVERPPLRVAIYARVSTAGQENDGYGMETQIEACKRLIEAKKDMTDPEYAGWQFAGDEYVFKDPGISGITPLGNRPGFAGIEEVLTTMERDALPFDAVIVYKIDRVARKLGVLMDAINLFEKNKLKFISVHESIDTSTPFGRAMLGIVGVIAELERETIATRTHDGKRKSMEAGIFMGGKLPLGYQKSPYRKLERCEKEVPLVQEIFRLFTKSDYTPSGIAKLLKDRKEPSPQVLAFQNGKTTKEKTISKKNAIHHWSQSTVKDILSNPLYIGFYIPQWKKRLKKSDGNFDKFKKNDVPAIIDRATFEIAREKLQTRQPPVLKGETAQYVLSGLIKCQSCFSDKPHEKRSSWIPVRRTIDAAKDLYSYRYQCGKKNSAKNTHICEVIPINGIELENYIINFCKDLIRNPRFIFEHQKNVAAYQKDLSWQEENIKNLTRQIETIPAQRENIANAIKEMGSNEEFKKTMKAINEREEKLKIDLSDIQKRHNELLLNNENLVDFAKFSELYGDKLESAFADKSQTTAIIRSIIKEIRIDSRDVTAKDRIAGTKKISGKQKIPSSMSIVMRLPGQMLNELVKKGFISNDPTWWR